MAVVDEADSALITRQRLLVDSLRGGEEEQQQERIESLCGCIDFQSVHVQGSKRLVGHKILSPRRFPLNGIICATCKGFAGGWVDVLSYRCHNFNNNDNNIIICILVVLSPFV